MCISCYGRTPAKQTLPPPHKVSKLNLRETANRSPSKWDKCHSIVCAICIHRETVLLYRLLLLLFAKSMPEQDLPPTIFHMLEKNVGNQIRVILDPSYGFEGTLVAVTREPAGIWLSEAEAVILRATIAQPIPQVTSREERSEIFVHLNSVHRIEVLHAPSRH
jgi:hypothetical protein